MKAITFENLRRLIGGRRKNKDRNESPFKRSDSFKRISIRRNYLECRGGVGGGQKGRNPTKQPPSKDADCNKQQSAVKTTVAGPPVGNGPLAGGPPTGPLPAPPKDDAPPPPPPPVELKRRAVAATPEPEPAASISPTTVTAPVIDYGEWIRCIRAEEDLNNLKRSCSPPTPPARYRYHLHRDLDDSSRADSAISLGRIWMDAPMLPPTAPRSLELPGRPVAIAMIDSDGQPQQRRAHHSLESALKDKRDDRPVPSRRFHRYPVAQLQHACPDKTASRSSVASTCSGKDSGFSLSAPGLSDPPRPSKQFFRKKAPRRPAAVADSSSASPALRDQLYQVVMARSPLRHQLKLDQAVTFVPPEKRRVAQHHNKHGQSTYHNQPAKTRPVVEIRDYCVPKDVRLEQRCGDADDTDGSQDRLYESISKARGRWQESTDDADTEDDDDQNHRNHAQYQRHQLHPDNPQHPQQRICLPSSAVVSRNRVKRKKSTRRNIKYVVKPVRRAPSAVTRKPSVSAKSKSAWITSTSYRKYIISPSVECRFQQIRILSNAFEILFFI